MTRRRTRLIGWIAGLLSLTMAGLVLMPGTVPTLATWNDREVAHGFLGVLDCADPQGQFASRGAGTMVSGSALGTDLDNVAEVQDAEVFHDGERSQAAAGPTDEVDAFFAPLGVAALRALDVDLGLIQVPLDTDTGVIGQYGQARSTGEVTGAAGLVNDEGVVALEPGSGYPQLATVQLTELLGSLNHDLSTLVGENVADVHLNVGAVAGRATLDGCEAALAGVRGPEVGTDAGTEAGTEVSGAAAAGTTAAGSRAALQETVSREYLVSSLETEVESPAVGTLVTGVEGVLTDLETAVNGLTSNQSVLADLTGGVSDLLGGLLGALSLGDISVALTATIDLSSVRNFLTEEFGDDGGILTVNPAGGTVAVDTAALLAAAYPGEYSNGLNGLTPNTDLLGDPAVVDTLTVALGQALDDWLDQIQTLLTEAVDAVHVEVDLTVDVRAVLLVLPVHVATIEASVQGSLGDLVAGSVQATTDVELLGAINLGLLDPLVNGLVNGLGRTVGNVVSGVLEPLSTLGTTVTDLTGPIVTAVSGVYDALYLDGLVSLTLNNQNRPFTGSSTGPPEWDSLPAGQYDVSALRLGILDAAGDLGVQLHLGRGSVGPVCLLGGVTPPDACPVPDPSTPT